MLQASGGEHMSPWSMKMLFKQEQARTSSLLHVIIGASDYCSFTFNDILLQKELVIPFV
jgi:hypothetical protein